LFVLGVCSFISGTVLALRQNDVLAVGIYCLAGISVHWVVTSPEGAKWGSGDDVFGVGFMNLWLSGHSPILAPVSRQLLGSKVLGLATKVRPLLSSPVPT
jgi:hypothetical protein